MPCAEPPSRQVAVCTAAMVVTDAWRSCAAACRLLRHGRQTENEKGAYES